ncbi:MAG: T9SS type A sorting domain-containing protein [Candidatus Zixiibacteriota bacterium]
MGTRQPIDPGDLELSITDLNGRVVKSFDSNTGFTFYNGLSFRFRAENLNSGIFFAKLRYNSQVFTKKIIYTK